MVSKQITTPQIDQIRKTTVYKSTATNSENDLIRWRRIVGSYQITIPVRTKEMILPRETRLLSVLRWILASLPKDDRLYPVFSRYVGQIGERVGALGGDPGQVRGSPIDEGEEPLGVRARPHTYNGKVTGLIYDCFGDFEGFLLDDCGTELAFQSREHQIEELVRIAWHERIAISVVTSAAHPRRPLSIILRHAPEPYQA